jgi:histidyl-tRNA synthetase
MEERGLFAAASRGADVLIAVPVAEVTGAAIRLAVELRAGGLRVDVFPHAAKLGAQFELAERKAIPYAIVADAAKLEAGMLEVRDLAARHSTAMARGDVVGWLRERLAAG